MEWFREYRNLIYIPTPNDYIIDTDRKVPAYVSHTYGFRAKRSGQIHINQFSRGDMGGGAYIQDPLEIYASTSIDFDTTTGKPTSYFAYAEDDEDFFFNVTKDQEYYVTIKGETNMLYTSTIRFSYRSCKYVSIVDSAISNFAESGFRSVYNKLGYITRIIPITFNRSAKIDIYDNPYLSGPTSIVNSAITTSLQSINADTGLPISGDITTEDSHYAPVSNTHKVANVVSGTQYYLYLVCQATGECYWYNTLQLTNPQLANIQFKFIDQFGSELSYGSASYYVRGAIPSMNLPAYYTGYGGVQSIDQNIYAYLGVGQPVKFMFDGPEIERRNSSSYKWIKFIGWYSDSSFRNLISDNPWSTEYIIPSANMTIYCRVERTNTDFNWSSTVSKDAVFNISAKDWNQFCVYAQLAPTFGTGWVYFNRNDLIEAEKFWRVKSAIDDNCRGYGITILPPTTQVHSGDIIYASYFNNLVTEARNVRNAM